MATERKTFLGSVVDFNVQRQIAGIHIQSAKDEVRIHAEEMQGNIRQIVRDLEAQRYRFPHDSYITIDSKSITPGLLTPLGYNEIRFLPETNELIAVARYTARSQGGQIITLPENQQWETRPTPLEDADWLKWGLNIINALEKEKNEQDKREGFS